MESDSKLYIIFQCIRLYVFIRDTITKCHWEFVYSSVVFRVEMEVFFQLAEFIVFEDTAYVIEVLVRVTSFWLLKHLLIAPDVLSLGFVSMDHAQVDINADLTVEDCRVVYQSSLYQPYLDWLCRLGDVEKDRFVPDWSRTLLNVGL